MSILAEQLKQPGVTPESVRAQGRRIELTRLDGIETMPVSWLWTSRMAAGMFGLFPGREGLGKSMVSYRLAADISRGRLDGCYYGTPKKVLICATEDSFAHTIVPRLVAADANLELIAKIDVFEKDHESDLELPVDLDQLAKEITTNEVALVILDPLLPRLSAKLDTHKDADVRRALEPLTKLAEATSAAVLGIIHVNKGSGGDPLNSIMGSRAFSAVARYTIYIAPDPDDDTIRLVGQAKNNVGPSDGLPLLPFRIEPYTFTNARGYTIETARLDWLEPDPTRSLREVLKENNDTRQDRKLDEAIDWLRTFLEGRDQQRALSSEVKEEADRAGHSERTVKRAAQKLGLIYVAGEGRGTRWWLLPSATAKQEGIPF